MQISVRPASLGLPTTLRHVRPPRQKSLLIRAATATTFKSFDDIITLSKQKPVLVDFFATWCGPCLALAKELPRVQELLGQNVQIIKIDSDKYPQISSRYEVQALPTLLLFSGGVVVDKIEGLMEASQLAKRVQYVLSKK